MTVHYTRKLTNSNRVLCFFKLLLRWRGSLYKLIWPDLFTFLSIYFSFSLLYRFVLDEDQKRFFEKVSIYCEKYATLIPVSFVLGFYVSLIVGRWWERYKSIPWIDTIALWLHANIRGEEEEDRMYRRNIVRYACLGITQCFILISPRVKARFPTLDHLVRAGILLENEKEILDEINASVSAEDAGKYPTNFIPFVWAGALLTRAKAENRITSDSIVKSMLDEINRLKDSCALLVKFDWVNIPLVYTQVVTLAVYSYFAACLMGRQSTTSGLKKNGEDALDPVFPLFTVLQFLFYMGWLKVAETLLNPFGDEDDDFELNWIVDRNIQVGYLIVDKLRRRTPEFLRDPHWDLIVPPELPHTTASRKYNEEPPICSTAGMHVTDTVELPAKTFKDGRYTIDGGRFREMGSALGQMMTTSSEQRRETGLGHVQNSEVSSSLIKIPEEGQITIEPEIDLSEELREGACAYDYEAYPLVKVTTKTDMNGHSVVS